MLKLKCSASIKSTNIQHSVLTNVLFSRYASCSTVVGPFTTGTYQIQTAFRKPRVLVVSDTRANQQPITEGSDANIPVIPSTLPSPGTTGAPTALVNRINLFLFSKYFYAKTNPESR